MYSITINWVTGLDSIILKPSRKIGEQFSQQSYRLRLKIQIHFCEKKTNILTGWRWSKQILNFTRTLHVWAATRSYQRSNQLCVFELHTALHITHCNCLWVLSTCIHGYLRCNIVSIIFITKLLGFRVIQHNYKIICVHVQPPGHDSTRFKLTYFRALNKLGNILAEFQSEIYTV